MNIFRKYCKVTKLFAAYRRIIKQRQYLDHLLKENKANRLKFEDAIKYIGEKYIGKYIKVDGKTPKYLYVDTVQPFGACLAFKDIPNKLLKASGIIFIKSFDALSTVHIITKREFENATK